MFRKIFTGLLLLLLILTIIYFLGPKPGAISINPVISKGSFTIENVGDYVAKIEAQKPTRKGNEAKIIWADSTRQKTKYALVYLHGFSASHVEGNPLHIKLAEKYKCNLYLSRLAYHGLSSKDPFAKFDGNTYLESAKEAIAIGQALGEEVIVLACSTGGTLATYLAANNPEMIDALMLYAPNIDVADPKSFLLSKPWGLQIARKVLNSNYNEWDAEKEQLPYWYSRYRIEGLVALKNLIDHTMTEGVFERIKQPLFVSYYFNDETHKDKVISIPRIKEFLSQVSTPKGQKDVFVCSDCGDHVITSDIVCQNMDDVVKESEEFLDHYFTEHSQ